MIDLFKKGRNIFLAGGVFVLGNILGLFLKTSSENAEILKDILEAGATIAHADVPGGSGGSTGTSSCSCATGGGTSTGGG